MDRVLSTAGMIKRGKAEKSAARGARLSAALRENLKRRKEQARARDRAAGRQVVSGEAETVPQSSDFRRNRG
jgi:hypothetical protein